MQIGFGIGLFRATSSSESTVSPSDPAALGALYWWNASDGLTQNGSVVSWTDRVSGVVLTNEVAANGVTFGKPERVINRDHNYRPALQFEEGAIHGDFPALPANTPLSVVVIGRASQSSTGNRVFNASGADLLVTTSSWALVMHDMMAYAYKRYGRYADIGNDRFSEVLVYEWGMGPTMKLNDMENYLDGTQAAFVSATSTPHGFKSEFTHVTLGATVSGTTPIIPSGLEIEHVIIFDKATFGAAERSALASWWDAQNAPPPIVPAPSVVLQYGQNNAVGIKAIPARDYARHGNVCFGHALLSWASEAYASGGSDRTVTQGLKEAFYESGMARGLDAAIDYQIDAASAADWQEIGKRYFALNPAVSNHSIEQLTVDDWARVGLDLSAAHDLEGGTFDWVWWVQGYSNASDARGAYAPKLRTLFSKMISEAEIAGYIGATPYFIIGQHCTTRTNAGFPSVSLSQLEVVDDHAGVTGAAGVTIFPLYPVPWKNGTHMNEIGQQLKGEMFGKIMADLDAGGYQPVRMTVSAWTDTEITLTLSGGNGTYALDTTNIPAAPNMGFDVWSDNDTTLQDIISGVALSGNTITLTLSAPAAAGSRLGYGWGRAGMAQPVNGPYALGNVRDTDPRTALVGGVSYPLYNWCLISEVVKP